MKFESRPLIFATLVLALLPQVLVAQSSGWGGMSLGDVARAVRKEKQEKEKKEPPPAQPVINNDNLSQVLQEGEKARLRDNMNFVFDGVGKGIQVSAPDVTCSLSFSAKTGALLSDPFVPEDLPRNELVNLDGPATIHDGILQITMHNRTAWSLREITVSLTIVRQASSSAALHYGSARLLPAAAGEEESAGKRADFTVLYHIKGSAAPFSTAVFQQELGGNLDSDQEWHWAVLQAQGIPPQSALPKSAPGQNLQTK